MLSYTHNNADVKKKLWLSTFVFFVLKIYNKSFYGIIKSRILSSQSPKGSISRKKVILNSESPFGFKL